MTPLLAGNLQKAIQTSVEDSKRGTEEGYPEQEKDPDQLGQKPAACPLTRSYFFCMNVVWV